MEELLIREVDGRKVKLINCNTYETYDMRITFYDLEEQPKAGDTLFIHKELLNRRHPKYSFEYYFGSVDSTYGREITGLDDLDAIKIVTEDEKEIILKRFYG